MSIIVDAFKNGAVTGLGSTQIVEKTYELGDGNHDVTIEGSKTHVIAGDGNTNVTTSGSDCSVELGDGQQVITHIGDNYKISAGDGNKKIVALGNGGSITTGDGDDDVTFVGDSTNVNLGDGDNNVLFWGNDCNIKTGNGNDSVTTFDQVYNDQNTDLITQAFVSKLPTDVWEDWQQKSRTQIDYKCKKHTFSKIQTWVYEEHYNVDTYFSTYINGCTNTNIDMGGGNNTANVTLDKETSTVTGSGTNNIKINDSWQKDYLVDSRDETKLDVEVKSNARWGNIALAAVPMVVAAVLSWGSSLPATVGAMAGTVASAVGTTAATATAIAGAVSTAVSVASLAYTAYNVGSAAYNIISGEGSIMDWVSLGTGALSLAGGIGEFCDTNVFSSLGSAGEVMSGITGAAGSMSSTWGAVGNAVGIAAKAASVADQFCTIKENGGTNLLGALSLGYSTGNMLAHTFQATGCLDEVQGAINYAKDSVVDGAIDGAGWVVDKIGDGATWLGEQAVAGYDYVTDIDLNGGGLVSDVASGAGWVVDKIGDGMSWVGDQVSAGAGWAVDNLVPDVVVDGVTWTGEQISDGAGWVTDKVGDGLSWVGDQVVDGATWVGNQVVDGATWVGNQVADGAEWAVDNLVPDVVVDGVTWTGEQISDGATWVGNQISDGASWVGEQLTDGATWVGNKVVDGATWVGEQVADGAGWVADKVVAGYDAVADTVGSMFDSEPVLDDTVIEQLEDIPYFSAFPSQPDSERKKKEEA